jgi:CRP-like cAMP-binding protein
MIFRNTFLSALGAGDMAALFPHLQEVALFDGESLGETGGASQSVYFPSNCAISMVTIMQDGREFETSSIGYEGVAGLLPALTDGAVAGKMRVQIGGSAVVLPAARLREQARRSPALLKLALGSLQDLSERAELSAACFALHPLSARLARWLLVCEDRVNRSQMDLTQDHLGVMASALRSSISLIASDFKDQGLIHYSRGHMEILDRPGLERRACECCRHDQARRDAMAVATQASYAALAAVG